MQSDNRIEQEVGRESIWSVRQQDRHKFSLYFSILFCLGLGFALWYEIAHVVQDSVFDTIIALMRDIGIVGISSATLSFARFEMEDSMGIALELFRKQRFEEGRAEGRAEGRKERDALRRRIAELESKNGSAPDGPHSTHSGDPDKE